MRTGITRTSISVSWTAPSLSAYDLPILGYILSVDDGVNLDPKPVYIGMNLPSITSYTVGNLITGYPYLFYV
jgi:hypothetical protein